MSSMSHIPYLGQLIITSYIIINLLLDVQIQTRCLVFAINNSVINGKVPLITELLIAMSDFYNSYFYTVMYHFHRSFSEPLLNSFFLSNEPIILQYKVNLLLYFAIYLCLCLVFEIKLLFFAIYLCSCLVFVMK